MFTGLVHCLGDVLATHTPAKHSTGTEARLVIRPRAPFAAPAVGESISVNGVCLTAESFQAASFTAYASAETTASSTLGSLAPGRVVNLERALALGERLGGHLVSGHVDCVARVVSREKAGSSTRFRLAFPPALARQVAHKGSVALDGVSLTVTRCGDDFLDVNVIPETIASTTIASWQPGTAVNMETDLIAKHIERLMAFPLAAAPQPQPGAGLTEAFLREHGF